MRRCEGCRAPDDWSTDWLQRHPCYLSFVDQANCAAPHNRYAHALESINGYVHALESINSHAHAFESVNRLVGSSIDDLVSTMQRGRGAANSVSVQFIDHERRPEIRTVLCWGESFYGQGYEFPVRSDWEQVNPKPLNPKT